LQLCSQGSLSFTSAIGTFSAIGIARYDTDDSSTAGIIDQVRIFNRALTATEVNTLYTEV